MGGRRFFAAISVCLACLATSCGEPDSELFAAGTFGNKHKPEIMRDCTESIQCAVQNDMDTPGDDPIGDCVNETARLLNDDKKAQQAYLSKFCRCNQFVVCDYYTCVTSVGGTSYGVSQSDKLTHDCQASIDCRTVMGTFTGDPGEALDSCVGIQISALDATTPEQRRQFENGYAMCSQLGGCDFQNCFNALRPPMQAPAGCNL